MTHVDLILRSMALKDVGDEAAAVAFSQSAVGDALLHAFRSHSWASFGFYNESVWTKELLVNFSFRLLGGEMTYASENESAARSVRPEDREVYDSLLPLELDDLVEMITDSYLGSSTVCGLEAGVTVPVLCSRVLRFWSVRANETDGRVRVGSCLDGFTIIGSAGAALKPLATTLTKIGLASRLGAFSGPGVQASTIKKRLLNFFNEFAPVTSVNGLIFRAASPSEGLFLFQKVWTEEAVLNLEVGQAVALCAALGLSPSTSASAPRMLTVTLAGGAVAEESSAMRSKSNVPSDGDSTEASAGAENFRSVPTRPERENPGFSGPEAAPAKKGRARVPVPLKASKRTKPERGARPEPLRLHMGQEDLLSESDSDSDQGVAREDNQLSKRLTDLSKKLDLLSPNSQAAESGQEFSVAATRVIRSLPQKMQPQFMEMVDENRNSVVSKADLEALRSVFVANQAAEEALLARRPLPDSVMKLESPILRVHSLYHCTRLGFSPHLGILAEELTIRTAGGRSLEASLAERQSQIKEESLRQEHATVGELLVLLLDELHPRGVLTLRTAERMMRRLVGLEVTAEKKGKNNQSASKTLAELADFMGTGMRVSSAAQTQLP